MNSFTADGPASPGIAYARAAVGPCSRSVSPPAGRGSSSLSAVAPNRIDPDAVDSRRSSVCPDPCSIGKIAVDAGSVQPIALRTVVPSLSTSDAAATRPTETSSVTATTGSPLTLELSCSAMLRLAGTTSSVHSDSRIGGRSAV